MNFSVYIDFFLKLNVIDSIPTLEFVMSSGHLERYC